jgi:futalosine hydrolase
LNRDLLLTATELERDGIADRCDLPGDRVHAEVIGVGLVAAAINAMQALQRHQPERVIVAGIAGRFARPEHATDTEQAGGTEQASKCPSQAHWFQRLAIDGIGVGQAAQFIDPQDLGWDFAGKGTRYLDCALPCPVDQLPHLADGSLVSVCAASADAVDAQWRQQRFPDAVAEDMESYAVVKACQTLGVPVFVLRGYSNWVGQRDHSSWQITPALQSVADQLQWFWSNC